MSVGGGPAVSKTQPEPGQTEAVDTDNVLPRRFSARGRPPILTTKNPQCVVGSKSGNVLCRRPDCQQW
jgi:hypothetical protein